MHPTPFQWKVIWCALAGAVVVGVVAFALYYLLPDTKGLGASLTINASPAFQQTLAWVVAGGYALIFFGMVVEGPMVTTAAAFAASLGYFNIWAVLLFAAMADFLADVGFYVFGRFFSRLHVLEKHGYRVGFAGERLKRVERLLQENPYKTILLLKLLPGAAVVGLPIVGAMRVPWRTYVIAVLSFILPSVALFGAMGYFFGETYEQASLYLEDAKYVLIAGIAIVMAIYYLYRQWMTRLARQLEHEP